jgi:LCP family protein required for cell wall assembly
MGKMKTKNNYLKYIAIALVLVFLIAAAFLLLEVWEDRQGRFPVSSTEDGVLTHNGQDYVYKDNIETFLVLGLDKYEGTDSAESHESGVQADFIMLFVFDNDKKQSTAIQINRDTMTKINKLGIGGVEVDSTVAQIALAYNYASDNDKVKCRNVKDSVEYLLNGTKVDHYLSLTMDAVPASCDFVGGVEVTVLDDFTGIDDALVKGEKVTLTGEQALRYVRTRYGLEDSTNNTRMARQQQYINVLYEKINANIEADDEFLVKLVETMDDYIVYDSSDQRMLNFAEKFDDYEFLGIRELQGQSQIGQEFMEFYPDEGAVRSLVVDLFYEPKTQPERSVL